MKTAECEGIEQAAHAAGGAAIGAGFKLAAQDRAGAVRPRLPFNGDVAGEPGDVSLPGENRQCVRIGHRDDVGVMRPLADVTGRKAGEPGAAVEQVIDVMSGHELRVGLAVHVDELGEQELDPTFGNDLAGVIGIARDRVH